MKKLAETPFLPYCILIRCVTDKEKTTASYANVCGKHSDSMWVNKMNIIIYLAHSYSSMVYANMYEITF